MYYVDFGNTETVPKSHVKRISASMLGLPAQVCVYVSMFVCACL